MRYRYKYALRIEFFRNYIKLTKNNIKGFVRDRQKNSAKKSPPVRVNLGAFRIESDALLSELTWHVLVQAPLAWHWIFPIKSLSIRNDFMRRLIFFFSMLGNRSLSFVWTIHWVYLHTFSGNPSVNLYFYMCVFLICM